MAKNKTNQPTKHDEHAEHMSRSTPKHLKDGPLEDRKCTDILCLIIFGMFWAGMFAIGYNAISTGQPLRLTYAYDQWGNACGVGDAGNYPYLMFLQSNSSTKYDLHDTACVEACPSADGTDVNCFNMTCTGQGDETVELFDRFCLPTDTVYQNMLVNSGLDFGFFSRAANDLMETWPMILAVGGIALVVGFIYLILMKFFSGILIWGLLAAFVLGTGGFGYVCLTTDTTSTIGSALAKLGPSGLKAVAYSCFAVAGISLLLVICLRERICLSIAVLKAATHFLADEPGILILPPIFFILTLVFYVGWVLVAAFIVGTNDIGPEGGDPYANVEWTNKGTGMFLYYFFGLLWNNALGVALSQFIIASAVCLWYFKQGTKAKGVSPIGRSLKRSVSHLGSLAFGSFLIGLFQFIQAILNYVQKKVTSIGGDGDGKKNFVFACLNCCFACFEKSLKFLTNHAYIQIAMTGDNFCKATAEAFSLAIRNAVRFGMVHGLAWVFLFFGQIIIAGCSTAIGYVIITQTAHYKAVVISPWVPSIFFFLTSYIIASVFMGIYGMTADTIVHCFAMDEEIHDGKITHAPEELLEYVNHGHGLNKKLLDDKN